MNVFIVGGQDAVSYRRRHAWRASSWEELGLQEDRPDDITSQEVKTLLLHLMHLSGQPATARPALELFIGDILTCTSVEPEGQDLYLCVTALLPSCGAGLPEAPILSMLGDDGDRAGFELLWHADRGCYIVVRKIALRKLTDERSVMDEILNTADLAQRCQRKITAR